MMLEDAPHMEIALGNQAYPELLSAISEPPATLYVIGDPKALSPGLAIVGARRATPYGLACAEVFASRAAALGVAVVSGGAIGCDQAAALGALSSEGKSVAVMGSGADVEYPSGVAGILSRIISCGGAVVSELPWGSRPTRWSFVRRNRIIAGLSRATLIVEAGIPSGTYSTAEAALDAGRDVLVVPGSIHSPQSRGSNALLLQGAQPIVDMQSFDDCLLGTFGAMELQMPEGSEVDAGCPPVLTSLAGISQHGALPGGGRSSAAMQRIVLAVAANPMRADEIGGALGLESADAVTLISECEAFGLIERYRDGRFGSPVPRRRRAGNG